MISCRLSVVSGQLSVASCQKTKLPVVSSQRGIVGLQLVVIGRARLCGPRLPFAAKWKCEDSPKGRPGSAAEKVSLATVGVAARLKS